MRLLHTSDWHLGRTLHNEPLIEAQRSALQQIVDIVDSHAIDAVLVAGDVFDRAVPPVESVTLLADTLQQLTTRVPVVVISGNHDSAVRLGFGAHEPRNELLAAPGVRLDRAPQAKRLRRGAQRRHDLRCSCPIHASGPGGPGL